MYNDFWHQHRPPMSDLEPAFVVPPHESCCPDPTAQQCECVTSGDIVRWDTAASAVDNLTPEVLSALTAVTAYEVIAESAANWNSAYNTVCAYSADWMKIANLETFSADTSDHFAEIEDELSEIRGSVSSVESSTADLKNHLHFDTELGIGSMTGDGTAGAPYGVKGWDAYSNLRTDVNTIMGHMREVPSADSHGDLWLTDGAALELEKTEKEYQDIAANLSDVHGVLSSHWDTIVWLMNNKAGAGESKTYVSGYGISVDPLGTEPNTYSISVNDIPEKYKNDIKTGIEAKSMVTELSAKKYVEFVKIDKPASEADVAKYKDPYTIFYC